MPIPCRVISRRGRPLESAHVAVRGHLLTRHIGRQRGDWNGLNVAHGHSLWRLKPPLGARDFVYMTSGTKDDAFW